MVPTLLGFVLVAGASSALVMLYRRVIPFMRRSPVEGMARLLRGFNLAVLIVAMFVLAFGMSLLLRGVIPASWLTWYTGRP